MTEDNERDEELASLIAIFPELCINPSDRYSATLELPVMPTHPLLVRFVPSVSSSNFNLDIDGKRTSNPVAYIEQDVQLSHLPPLTMDICLPQRYPAEAPPKVRLTVKQAWLPQETLAALETEAQTLWEEYGRCQVLFAYIDYLQQAAERGFDLDQGADGCLQLPLAAKAELATFDVETKQAIFNAGTYDCGICLEPKKGSLCYRLPKCGHVFCKACSQDFYNSAITEGNIASVKCLSPECGKAVRDARGRIQIRKTSHTLHPRDLLAMGVNDAMVRRYVELKRKKKIEADQYTVFCPRTWCQGAARSPNYPPIPADLSQYDCDSSEDEEDSKIGETENAVVASEVSTANKAPPDPNERLAICERCTFAFCRVCFMGWHGPTLRCYPRDPNELSADEKASYEFIRLNTSPCPYCNSPTQKTMGCNHMICFQCTTHYCYLCSSWLDAQNPYQHFNKSGTECYQRLWELDDGDNGQAPADGRGFAGNRNWERMAIEAAREAEAEEAAAQAEEDERFARGLVDQEDEGDARVVVEPANGPVAVAEEPDVAADLARVNLQIAADVVQPAVNGNARRQRNPFPARPRAGGAADAVRNHERGRAPRPVVRMDDEIQRFLNMAERDEEDGWDSDELGDDDAGFQIR